MDAETAIERRFQAYARRRQLEFLGILGAGIHGRVFRARPRDGAGEVAVKVHYAEAPFERELEVNRRLRDARVILVCGSNVPQLLGHDPELFCLELTIVPRPFVLDFAEVRFAHITDFSEDTWALWEVEKQEQFDDNWPLVRTIMREFESLGIYLLDARQITSGSGVELTASVTRCLSSTPVISKRFNL